MAFNVNLFQGALKLGGARSTLFQVYFTNPVDGAADISVPFLCKTASLPASTIGSIPLGYFGRKIQVAGDRTYEPWTVTIINDEDFGIRNAIENWSHAINGPISNLRDLGSTSPLLYKTDAQVTQFSKTGVPVRTYNMVGIFPTEIGAIDLGWDNNDTVEEFTVTFNVDYWEVNGGITGQST
jgi:hypothetical protein